MTTIAVVPIKGFGRAKSRLGEALDDDARRSLAIAYAEHVVALVRDHPGIDDIIVCSEDDGVLAFAAALGAVPLRDPERATRLNEIVDEGLALAVTRGATRTLVLMSDLPHLVVEDLDALLDEPDASVGMPLVVLAPDRRGRGTNALVMSPPDALPTCFGDPDSLTLHRERADALGLPVRWVARAGLARDIDVAEDLTEGVSHD